MQLVRLLDRLFPYLACIEPHDDSEGLDELRQLCQDDGRHPRIRLGQQDE
jgi:hypothetical protein